MRFRLFFIIVIFVALFQIIFVKKVFAGCCGDGVTSCGSNSDCPAIPGCNPSDGGNCNGTCDGGDGPGCGANPTPTGVWTCFLPGTEIGTPGGTKKIENMKEMDVVKSFTIDGKVVESKVSKIFERERDFYFALKAGKYEVKASAEHPFLTDKKNNTYTEIQYLKPGDTVFVREGDKYAEKKVTSNVRINEKTKVYNMSVDNTHTYFAGGFAVHNKGNFECNNRTVNCPTGYTRTNTPAYDAECKSWYGGVAAWCTPPGTAQSVTGCCSAMIQCEGETDPEKNDCCRYGDDQITTYTCVSNNSPPTGTLSCPSQIVIGTGSTFTLYGNDVDNNLQTAKLWRTASPPSNAFTELWSGGCSGGSCTSTVTWTPSTIGQYTFATTYHDTAGAQCSGNPYYSYEEYPVWGFDACSNPLTNDSCTVDVCALYNGPNGVCGGGNEVATCNNLTASCSTGTFSWNDSTGADGVFNWGCSGTAGTCGGTSGSAVTCSAPHLPDISGVCGSSDGQDFISAPASNLCDSGTLAWDDNGGSDGFFNWSCTGQCSGGTASCWATRNLPPAFTSLTIKNNSGTAVVAESGNRNQICQTEFGGSRAITLEVRASDPDGVADISNITVVWNGKTIPRLSAIGAVTTFGGTPDSSFNDSLAHPIVVTITDSFGQVATDNSRSFKIWDCIVPVSGAIYDDSPQAGCVGGFSLPADSSINFTDLIYHGFGTGDVAGNRTTWSNFGPSNLIWGKSYLPLINGGGVGNIDGNLMATGRTTRLNGVCQTSPQFDVEVDAYTASPALTMDLAYIRDQENWYQGNGIDIRAGIKITEGVPVTALNPYLVLNGGVVAAPILVNTNGYNNDWHYGFPNNWFLEKALIDPHKYSYQSIYDEYFTKMGEGVTGVTVINAGSTGILFVNDNLTISNDVEVANNKYLMVVVNGNVTIDQTVNNVDGIYVAKNISAGGYSNTQLVINGVLYATNGGNIQLNRSFTIKRHNNPTPAVAVNYRPDMIFALPGRLSKILSGWKEL